jgi:hypothetical protein
MKSKMLLAGIVLLIVAGMVSVDQRPVHAGEQTSVSGYKVLEPIRHGSLTVFPVVAPKSYSTSQFMTLDEGLRSGEVVVTEYGNVRGLVRRHVAPALQHDSAEVNRLVLINNSKRPLLLLAGEIVTGGKPIEQSYQSLIKQLRDRNAVGVVVALNGRIIWADVFASTELLEKYWPKLVRSYASEAVVTRAKGAEASTKEAEAFLGDMEGRKETIESEPGIYRHTEVSGDGFKAFALTSLLPKTGFDIHVAKMAE